MREFIELMREKGEVTDIDQPVDIRFEAPKMAAKTDKLLFFHNAAGHRAVMNVTATRTALSLALGIKESEIVKELAARECRGRVVEEGDLKMDKADLIVDPCHDTFSEGCGPLYHIGNCIFTIRRR